jgi:CheY-like chemotaxis protein
MNHILLASDRSLAFYRLRAAKGDAVNPTTCAILVVEDNPDEFDLIREALMEVVNDMTVTMKGTVGSALEWLAAQSDEELPALILTDHHLPDRRGHDLINTLRASPRNSKLHVVMLSGDAFRPSDIDGIAWYGKPDSWSGWRELALILVERHIRQS